MNMKRILKLLGFIVIFSGCTEINDQSNIKNPDTSKAENNKPESSSLKRIKADIAYNSYNYNLAEKLYSSLICVDSTDGSLFYKRGVCFGKLYNQKKAIKDFQKSIELKYRISDSYCNMSIAYITILDDSSAIVCINKCLSINPNDTLAKELAKGYIKIHKVKTTKCYQ